MAVLFDRAEQAAVPDDGEGEDTARPGPAAARHAWCVKYVYPCGSNRRHLTTAGTAAGQQQDGPQLGRQPRLSCSSCRIYYFQHFSLAILAQL